jgi:hypothetical protein
MATFNVEVRQRIGGIFDDIIYPKAHWNNLDGKPATYTPTAHNHNASDINAGTLHADRIPTLPQSKIMDLTNDLAAKAAKEQSIYYVNGTGTTGVWAGTIPEITSLYAGLVISYKTPAVGISTGTTLNINGYGPVNIRYNHTSNLTTHLNTAGTVVVLTYDGTYWQWANYTDGTDSYRQRWNTSIQVGQIVTREKIVMQSNDGKWYPLISDTTDSVGTTKIINQVGFLVDSLLVYGAHTSNIAADGIMLTTNNYAEIVLDNDLVRRNFNQHSGWVANQPVYLKGTINSNGLFVLDNTTLTSYMTQTLPTTDDGFVYIMFGIMRSTTVSFMLYHNHPAYQFKNGKLRPYETDDPKPASDVYAWAKAANKPSYTAAEVGALASSHAASGVTAQKITNWDNAFGWGNHAGLYKALAWFPTWNEVTDKPSTFPPSAHAITAHASMTAERVVGRVGSNGVPQELTQAQVRTFLGLGDAAYVTLSASNRFVTDTEKSTWNGKQNAITGGATTIVSSNLTANRVLVSDSSGKVAISSITTTVLGYLDATSSIQTQLNGKQNAITGGATTIVSSNLTPYGILVSDQNGKVAVMDAPGGFGFVTYDEFGEWSHVESQDMLFTIGAAEWVRQNVPNPIVNYTTAANFTLGSTHANRYLRINTSGARTITIPTNTTWAAPTGTEIHIERTQSTIVTITPAGGVTLVGAGAATKSINAQYQVVTLKKVDTNTWVIFGALTP